MDAAGLSPLNEAQETAICALWPRIRLSWGQANEIISDGLREHGRLSSRDRRAAADRLHQLIRHWAFLEWCFAKIPLRLSGPAQQRERTWIVGLEVVTGRMTPDVAAVSVPWVDWDKVARIAHADGQAKHDAAWLARHGGWPDGLARMLWKELGERAIAFSHALTERAPTTLRVVQGKATREQVLAELAALDLDPTPTTYSPWGINLGARASLTELAAFREGRIEIQDEASQLVACLVAPEAGQLVLDLCAGAGGKALAMASMAPLGRLVAIDAREGALTQLRRRAKRAGLARIESSCADATKHPAVLEPLRDRADRVLVDAPCTGLGAARRRPGERWTIDDGRVKELLAMQAALLSAGAASCRPGGLLVYATCTVLAAENEEQVRTFLSRNPSYSLRSVTDIMPSLAPLAAPFTADDPASGTVLRTWPERDGMDGFFVAVLERRAG